MSTTLRAALEQLVAPCQDEPGDWDDVLRRAEVTRPSRAGTRRPRKLLVALGLLSLAIVVLATPAFGLRAAVLGLIGREDVAFEQGGRAPAVVRKQFEDLALGVPPSQNPQALPGQMRRVGAFRIGGMKRTLWAGPTRRGGFCYSLERRGGGCLRDPREREPAAIAHSLAGRQRDGEPPEVTSLTGWLFAPEAERLTVEFEDGQAEELGFVYVSAPIDAGFFAYDIRGERRRAPRRPSALVLRDDADRVIARETISHPRLARIPRLTGPQEPRLLPARPRPAPSKPLQVAQARGVSVTAGANGSVLFDARSADELVSRLAEKSATYVCLRLRNGNATALGHQGGYAPTVGVRYFGLKTPFDGCEIQGSYGHRWPDRLGSHSTAEIAFTPAARRYYEDRAAARDLALFVRSGRVQRLRKLDGDPLAQALARAYGARIVRLPDEGARPSADDIGYWTGSGRSVFRRVSTTGRVFEVEVAEERIERHNLRELAKVF